MKKPYVPTPEDLDVVCARISASGYASDAVEAFEEWTREKWGVESAFTTKFRAEREAAEAKKRADAEAATPFVSPSPFSATEADWR